MPKPPRQSMSGRVIARATRTLVHAIPVLVLGGPLSPPAAAQVATARMRVTVAPPSSAAAVVTVRAVAVITPTRRADTDALGGAVLLGLEPGSYEIRVERSGDRPAVARVTFEPGESLAIRADLAAQAVPRVASRLAVTTRETFRLQTHFAPDRLRTFPSSGAVWSLIETAAPVTFADRMDTGGVLAGQASLIGSRGSSWTQASFRMDGLDITDQTQGGSPLAYPDPTAFSAMTVLSGLMPIEQDAPGPVVTLVTQRPRSVLHGSAQLSVSPSGLQARGPATPPPIARLDSWRDGSVGVGGPLGSTRSGGFLSARVTRASTLERADPLPLSTGVASIFAHAAFLPTTRDEIRVTAAGQRVRRPFEGRARLVDRGTTEVARFLQLQSSWGRVRENGSTWSIEGGMQRGRVRPELEGTVAGTVERLRDGPVPALAFATGGSRWRWTGGAHVQPMPRTLGGVSHATRLGATVSRSGVTRTPLDVGPTAEQVDGLPARVWEYGYPGATAEWRQTAIGLYAADRIEVTDRLALEAGVRFDVTDGSAANAPQGIGWRSASGSLSGRWNFREGETAIIGGYRRYQYRLALQHLAFGDAAGPQGIVYRWADPNADGVYQTSERGPLIAYVGPGAADARSTIDPQLTQPHTDEVILGFETRWLGAWLVRFIGTARRDRRLLASVNVRVPDSQYTVSFIPDTGIDLLAPPDHQLVPVYDRHAESFGQDRTVLTNSDLGASYKGLELTIETPRTQRLQILLGATASTTAVPAANRGFQYFENDHGTVGELLENPNAGTFGSGRAFFDRGYSASLSGSYRLPRDTLVAAVARYQDGQAFARYLVAPDLTQGPEAIRAVSNGLQRFTLSFTLDMRLEKAVRLGDRRFVAGLDMFNLWDTTHEVEEDVATGPAFRTPTAMQPPRAVRLTGRLEF